MNQSLTADHRLKARRQRVADVIAGIVRQAYLGALIYGPGGTGKSNEIFSHLDAHGASYALANSRLTGLGLFDFLRANQQRVNVIEDAESLLDDRHALGVLRSATQGSQVGRDGRQIRLITYHSHGKQREFIFTGTIVLSMNRNLSQASPEAQALATRLQVVDYSLEDEEVSLLMRSITEEVDHQLHLSIEERVEVTEFVIRQAKSAKRRLDLRMQQQAFETYALFSLGHQGLDWHDTVDSQIAGYDIITTPVIPADKRTARIQREREIVRSIVDLPTKERLERWMRETGGSRASLYRRIAELGQLDNADTEPIYEVDSPNQKAVESGQR